MRPFSEETFVVRENNPSLSRQPPRPLPIPNTAVLRAPLPSRAGVHTDFTGPTCVGLIYRTQYRPIFTDWMIGIAGAPRPIEWNRGENQLGKECST